MNTSHASIDPINPVTSKSDQPDHSPQLRPLWAWLMWGVTVLFVFLQFLLQLSAGEMVSGLINSFSLSAFGVSVLVSTYYYIYVTLQMPAGFLLDRFGARRLLSIAALICASGCFLFSSTHSIVFAAIGRLLMGGGAAFAFVGAIYVIARWFPARRFSFMIACIETVGMFGAVCGTTYLAALVQTFGWRLVIVGAALLLIIAASLIFLIVRDSPVVPLPTSSPSRLWDDLKAILKNSQMWIIALYSGFLFSVVTVFVALWGVSYLQVAHGFSLVLSTFICNLVFVGIAVGAPLIGWLEGHLIYRRFLLAFCAIVAALLLIMIIYIPTLPLFALIVLMPLLGMFLSAYILPFGIATEITPAYRRGSSIGFVNMISVGTAPILQPLLGFFMDCSATYHHPSATTLHTVVDYQTGLLLLPIIVFISGLMSIWVPKKYKTNNGNAPATLEKIEQVTDTP